MSFYRKVLFYRDLDLQSYWRSLDAETVRRILLKDRLSEMDFLALLSDQAEAFLEEMAWKAARITVQHFGRVIFLYTPLYLSNYCENECLYCSFNARNPIARKILSLAQVEAAGRDIAATGMRHLLILTGESRRRSPVSYIADCLEILRKQFCSIGIEVYPLSEEEYRFLTERGADSLTIYQEVYDEKIYDRLHPRGPKRDFHFRLDAPERACRAGMRAVNVGALLGLAPWAREVFMTGLHAAYLQDRYPAVEIGVSLPRLQPFIGDHQSYPLVSDKKLVQAMLALRLFLPRAGITISTRERPQLRDNLIGLGVTRMSAGSSTRVGGHTFREGTEQFAVSDHRGVPEIRDMISGKGYQPVFKDWHPLLEETVERNAYENLAGD